MAKITKEMTFGEIIRQLPQSGPVFGKYGLHCIGCHIGLFESLEEGMRAHGQDDAAVSAIVDELNQLADK